MQHHYYSGTSLNKPSELRDSIEKTSIIWTKILVPKGVTNTFSTSERGNLYCSKKWPKISGPKVSVIERLHCMWNVQWKYKKYIELHVYFGLQPSVEPKVHYTLSILMEPNFCDQ